MMFNIARRFSAFWFLSLLLLPGAQASQVLIAFLGDSLTEGYGVSAESAYPRLLQAALKKRGKNVEVLNVSISGSTSASAPARMKKLLEKKPNVIVLALGANDALRGLKPAAMEKNLSEAIALARAEKIKVLLAAPQVPSPYGPKYSEDFEKVFDNLKRKHSVVLLRDFLAGVLGKPDLNQDDGLHPNAKGHQLMADKMLPVLEKLL